MISNFYEVKNDTRTWYDEEVVVKYDQHLFVSLRTQENYYSNLIKKKLLLERGITLDKVDEMLLNFYQRLEISDRICFDAKPCKANEQLVRYYMLASWKQT